MRIVGALLVALALFVAWRLGVLGVVVTVLVWIWTVAPAPMTVLYAAAACGITACFVYPRHAPGVVWTSVLVRSPQAQRPRGVTGAAWDDRVSEYLERLRGEQDRAVA